MFVETVGRIFGQHQNFIATMSLLSTISNPHGGSCLLFVPDRSFFEDSIPGIGKRSGTVQRIFYRGMKPENRRKMTTGEREKRAQRMTGALKGRKDKYFYHVFSWCSRCLSEEGMTSYRGIRIKRDSYHCTSD
jgi:hypothetical protein